MRKIHLDNTAVGWTAMTLGLITATTPAWAQTSPVGAGFTLGFGAMTVMYSGWSLIARDPTRDHWALSVVGLIWQSHPGSADTPGTPLRGCRGSAARR